VLCFLIELRKSTDDVTMGKLMIRKLREDWTATRGGRQAWRDFHDRFLSFGGPPIPLVRKAMLGKDEGALFCRGSFGVPF